MERLAPLAGSVFGTWLNDDPNTRGYQKIVVALLEINVFGVHIKIPTVEGWASAVPIFHLEKKAAVTFGPSVATPEAVSFTTAFPEVAHDIHFADTTLAGHVEGAKLVLEVFTVFVSGDTRTNLYTRETFHRG